jgi:hypothetical protein
MKSFREARVQRSFERPSLSTKAERSLNYQLRTTRLPWSGPLSLKREPTKGQDTSGRGSWMDVFVKRGDKWVMVRSHSSWVKNRN